MLNIELATYIVPLCPFKKSNQVLSFHVFRFAEQFLESLGPFSRNLYTETSQIWRFGSGRPPILSWELEKQQQSNIGFTPFDTQGFQCTGRAVVSCCLTGRSTWCFLLGDAMKHLSRGISAGSFHLGCMVKCTKGISVLWCYWCFRSAWITWRALWATLRTTTTRFEAWQWLLGDTCTSFWGCLFSAFQVLQLQRSDSAKLSSELRTHQVKRLIGKSAFVRSCAWFLAFFFFFFFHACKITQFGAAVSTCLKFFRSHPNNYHSWFLAMCDCHHLPHLIFMCHNSVTTSKSHRSLYIVWSIVAPKWRSCCSFVSPCGQANHATLADRMGYLEKLMGDSFEKHAKVEFVDVCCSHELKNDCNVHLRSSEHDENRHTQAVWQYDGIHRDLIRVCETAASLAMRQHWHAAWLP